MPDRVFTTQEKKDGLGPPEVIQTIDVNKVAELMQGMQGQTVPQAPSGLIDLASIVQAEKKSVPAEPAPQERAASAVPTQGTCDVCGVPHPCSHDVLAARTAGNDQAVALMNEIRNQRRMAMVAQHEDAVRTAYAEQEQRLAERRAIAEGLDELEGVVNPDEASEGEAEQTDATAATTDEPTFQTVDELTASQRDRFAKWAEAQGWPKEYIEAFVTPKQAEAEIPHAIMVVASSDKLDEETKKAMISEMCREAKLKPEQAERVRRYWSKELGYPDTEWVNDLVAEPDIK